MSHSCGNMGIYIDNGVGSISILLSEDNLHLLCDKFSISDHGNKCCIVNHQISLPVEFFLPILGNLIIIQEC